MFRIIILESTNIENRISQVENFDRRKMKFLYMYFVILIDKVISGVIVV